VKFLVNIHKTGVGDVITICDHELYGSILKDGEIMFEINEFYNGKEYTKEELPITIFKSAVCIHVIGEESLKLLRDLGIVQEKDMKFVRYVQGVPILILFNVQKILY